MNIRYWTLGLGTLGLGLALAFGNAGITPVASAQEAEAGQQDGVEVQARGPVHEAYAEPGSARPQPFPVIPKQPPEPVDEIPPDQKPDGENVQWLPGYWAWDEDPSDFLWVSGCWRAIPPNHQWMPGTWAQAENGWQWSPGYWVQAGQEETEIVPPPPETIERGPSTPAPSAESLYVNGCWVYRTRRFAWRPGFWYTPRPGWIYVPARYVWTPCGCVFVEGYWDYPLEARGCLFAPVAIERRCWSRPRWVYRPRYVVYTRALLGSLFVRPACGCYYFGDYFEARYKRRGFVSWVDYRVTRSCYDPLFTYCRWQYRGDRLWERNLRTLYINRWNGTVARPPRTFVQQTTVVNNITIRRNVNITNVTNVTMLAPVTRVDRRVLTLRPVPRAQRAQEWRAAREVRAISKQRQQITARIVARGPAPTRSTDVPRVARVRMPRLAAAARTITSVKPPPLPIRSRRAERRQPRTEPVNPRINPRPRTDIHPERRPINPTAPRSRTEPKVSPNPVIRSNPRPLDRPAPRPEARPTPKSPVVRPVPKPQPAPAAVRPPVVHPARPVQPAARPQPRPAVRPPMVQPSRPMAVKPPAAHPSRPTAVRPPSPPPARPVAKPSAPPPPPPRGAARPVRGTPPPSAHPMKKGNGPDKK